MRKLIVAMVSAIAMSGAVATNANAAVEVGNPGPFTLDVDFILASPSGPGHVTLNCNDNTFEGTVDEYGVVDLYDIEINAGTSDSYSQWVCESLDDCDQAGAAGQIVGPGDPGYTDFWGHDFLVRFEDWCLETPHWGGPWVDGTMIVGIAGAGESQAWDIPTTLGTWKPGWTASGTVASSEALDITSID